MSFPVYKWCAIGVAAILICSSYFFQCVNVNTEYARINILTESGPVSHYEFIVVGLALILFAPNRKLFQPLQSALYSSDVGWLLAIILGWTFLVAFAPLSIIVVCK